MHNGPFHFIIYSVLYFLYIFFLETYNPLQIAASCCQHVEVIYSESRDCMPQGVGAGGWVGGWVGMVKRYLVMLVMLARRVTACLVLTCADTYRVRYTYRQATDSTRSN
jgi:predicted MFS family arabinose efflux permease